MLNIFKSAEQHLQEAKSGMEKYITKFKLAEAAARKEIIAIEHKISDMVERVDARIEAAYEAYMQEERNQNAKVEKAIAEADERKAVLTSVASQAQTAVDNHNKIYLGK